MNRPASGTKVGATTLEQARGFLSSLFLGLRTAQIHDPSNRAFTNAAALLYQSASALYTATGGFSIQLTDDAALLNGQPLRFEGGAPQAIRTLKSILASAGMGGIEMRNPPTEAAMRKLLLLFSTTPERSSREDVEQDIGVIDRQAVDRKTHAVRCYAKLILALRDQVSRGVADRRPARLRAIRIIQELIEIAQDRADYLSRLARNDRGAAEDVLIGANATLIALLLGRGLGLSRQDLVDVGLAALFHRIGGESVIPRLAREGLIGPAQCARMVVIGERTKRPSTSTHPFARIVAVAVRYVELCSSSTSPAAALADLMTDDAFDDRIADLAINVLRVYPVGADVILDSGSSGKVVALGKRLDRPTVRIENESGTSDVDLDAGGDRIASTRKFAGKGERHTLDEVVIPAIFTDEQLAEIGVAPAVDIEGDPDEPMQESEESDRRPVVPVAAMGELGVMDKEVTEQSPIPSVETLDVPKSDPAGLYPVVDRMSEATEQPTTELDEIEVLNTGPVPIVETAQLVTPLISTPPLPEIGDIERRLNERRKREADRDDQKKRSLIRRIEAQVQVVRNETDELREEAGALESDAVGAKRVLDGIGVRIDKTVSATAEIAAKAATLEKSLDGLWASRQKLSEEASFLEQQAATAIGDAAEAEAKASEAAEEADARAARIAELEAELDKLREEHAELSQAAETFRNAAAETRRLGRDAQVRAEEIRNQAQATIPALTASEEELDTLRADKAKLEAEKVALEANRTHATALVSEAEARLADAKARLEESEHVLADLEKDLSQARGPA